MKQARNRAALWVVSCMSLLVFAASPVAAMHTAGGGQGTGSNDVTTTSVNEGARTNGVPQTPVESNDASDTSTNTSASGVRAQAAQLLQQERQNDRQQLKADAREKVCENRKADIDRRSDNFTTAAQRHLDVFNDIFTKLQAYHDKKNPNVSNYDTLVADATAKQTAATSAVAALKGLDVNIDCSSADPASTVANIKVAVQNARQTLGEYRTALKNLVVALKTATTTSANTSNTEGN